MIFIIFMMRRQIVRSAGCGTEDIVLSHINTHTNGLIVKNIMGGCLGATKFITTSMKGSDIILKKRRRQISTRRFSMFGRRSSGLPVTCHKH